VPARGDARPRDRDDLAAGAGGQRRQDRVGLVAQEADAAVGEEEVGPAAVQAPEVVAVARVVEPAGAEAVARPAAAVVQVRY